MKKGGDNIGYSGHKHFKGEKVVAIVDRNVNVIAPYITAPGNRNESPLRGKKRVFSESIFKERFRMIERLFAWEDKFKRLLLERKSENHFGLKLISYAMINLRHF